MCVVGSSNDQESPGVAPKYLWLAFAEAIRAADERTTDFEFPVDPLYPQHNTDTHC